MYLDYILQKHGLFSFLCMVHGQDTICKGNSGCKAIVCGACIQSVTLVQKYSSL
jgi:hypothetical protein